jgi:hypothetical protein
MLDFTIGQSYDINNKLLEITVNSTNNFNGLTFFAAISQQWIAKLNFAIHSQLGLQALSMLAIQP